MMRIEQEEFQEWNMVISMLVQVSVGRISPNMRQVGLRQEDGDWIVEFVLKQENESDREEIEDIGYEFSFLTEGHSEYGVQICVIVDDGPPENFPKFEGFAGPIYRRWEV